MIGNDYLMDVTVDINTQYRYSIEQYLGLVEAQRKKTTLSLDLSNQNEAATFQRLTEWLYIHPLSISQDVLDAKTQFQREKGKRGNG